MAGTNLIRRAGSLPLLFSIIVLSASCNGDPHKQEPDQSKRIPRENRNPAIDTNPSTNADTLSGDSSYSNKKQRRK